jgi:hypothetical protein
LSREERRVNSYGFLAASYYLGERERFFSKIVYLCLLLNELHFMKGKV